MKRIVLYMLLLLTTSASALTRSEVLETATRVNQQGTGKEPKDAQPVLYDKLPDFDDYGIGCFLLCASEVYKLTK